MAIVIVLPAIRRSHLGNPQLYNGPNMKITVDTTDVLDGVQFLVITPKGHGNPVTGRTYLLLLLLECLWNSVKLTASLIPAMLYIFIMVTYWPELKAEGLSVWEAGTGLVALYGLGLRWWRTSTQDKLYKVEMKKAYRSDLN